jgi:hypothetical protein
MRITLTMTIEQAEYLSRILEISARIGIGQFKDMVDLLTSLGEMSWDEKIQIEDYIKSKIFPELQRNAYFGIRNINVKEECKIAWDCYQILRRELSWMRAGKDWRIDKRDWLKQIGVNYDDPMKCSSLEGTFNVERIDE